MRPNLTFWLALIAALLAGSAVAVRVARDNYADWSELLAPIAIGILMLGIMTRNWPGRSDNG